ncbi:hypothetical protein LINPERPRIM_LOCUS7863 [Linum perenne]
MCPPCVCELEVETPDSRGKGCILVCCVFFESC